MHTLARRLSTLACIAWAAVALAQGANGRISGKLTDPNGLAVANLDQQGVELSMKDQATGKVYSTPIRTDGSYDLKGLPAGTYDLAVPLTGSMYRGFEQKTVAIAAGETLAKDIALPWSINLGTIGDDPTTLSNDLRARSKNTKGPTPRTREGHPDLTGMWYGIPVNTPRGAPKMKPWAQQISDTLRRTNSSADGGPGNQGPAAYCLPQSATPVTLPFPYEFIQTKDRLIQLTEFLTPGHREIYLDGRPHPDMNEWNPGWYGHSIGHWEKDTLVIDTVGFNEITPSFAVHSEKLHVIERIQRPSKDKLVIDIFAEDPEAWTETHKAHYDVGLVTGEAIQEWVCAENNRADHFGIQWKGRP
jgi:hypothetical protein